MVNLYPLRSPSHVEYLGDSSLKMEVKVKQRSAPVPNILSESLPATSSHLIVPTFLSLSTLKEFREPMVHFQSMFTGLAKLCNERSVQSEKQPAGWSSAGAVPTEQKTRNYFQGYSITPK